MSSEAVEQARKSFSRAEQVAAVNDLVVRTRYSYRHDPNKCPPGLPESVPDHADEGRLAAAYAALEALPLQEVVRGLCEPMNGAFPSESVVRVLTRCLAQGAELERRYRVNTGVPAA